MNNPLIITFILFVLGSMFGSFASALIYRFRTNDKGFWTKRSKCPHCQKELTWANLIPIFSYIYQKGKCSNCHKKIGISYLIHEITLGLLFTLPYLFWVEQFTLLPLVISYIVIFSGFLIVSYDAQYQEIPDLFTFSFMISGGLFGFLTNIGWQTQLVGALIAGGFFGLQYLVSKGRWIGSGDILIGIGMGLTLGAQQTIVALIISYIGGSLIGLILLSVGKAKRKSTIAFAPFLLAGTLIALFWGEAIYTWYTNLTFTF
ncbi:hypothetical protein CO045_01370 [Candidatus Peregrinibacteria bacterium CG_4_9_14_0_2_um_filter_41_14]|nr:MAG: hypothetical protein COY06_00030 [Candidatus Peregrinibacteria bacterium CG_4_10_14_0_2_um_filter_41_8]PJC38216.1 MAG: hypothetical protein CO045_01370 [Candidatus Peregrinibacteria bacterium CG_4_9_14_0_2_um_filter_41_14]